MYVCIFKIRYKPQPVSCKPFCWLLVLLKARTADFTLQVKSDHQGTHLYLTSATPHGFPIFSTFIASVIKKASPSHPHPHRDHMWNQLHGWCKPSLLRQEIYLKIDWKWCKSFALQRKPPTHFALMVLEGILSFAKCVSPSAPSPHPEL